MTDLMGNGPFDPSTPGERAGLVRWRLSWQAVPAGEKYRTFHGLVLRYFPDARDVDNIGIGDCTLFNAAPHEDAPAFFKRINDE